jgi:hypothetical protein
MAIQFVGIDRKSGPADQSDIRVRQMDELQRISQDYRDTFYGQTWFADIRDFYNLQNANQRTPTFRPRVIIPQLQMLVLGESTDLSDSSPIVYVYDPANGQVDSNRSKAFKEQWRESEVPYHLLMGDIWANLSGIGYLQTGFDPNGDCGRGKIWVRHRDPESVFLDPGAMDHEDWSFIMFRDRMYPDKIRSCFPETGRGIEAAPYTPGVRQETSGYGFKMPPGPMAMTGVADNKDATIQGDGRVEVRYLLIDDRSIEVVRSYAGTDAGNKVIQLLSNSSGKVPLYPNGRIIVDAQKRVIADGNNPNPLKEFPLTCLYGMPPLTSIYGPPPTRYTRDLQDLAGRLLTQTFENVIRLNNAVWFIDENTGINPEAFGGLPGEIQIINSQSKPPTPVWPTAIPQQLLQLPQVLLNFQKELQGVTQSREGTPGAGNISPELFEASIYRSQRLTRMRARLLARSIGRLSKLMFDLMQANYRTGQKRFYSTENNDLVSIPWLPLGPDNELGLFVDQTSLLPISQAALRTMAPMLRQAGALDVKSFLEYLEVPNAAEIAAKLDREQQLAALTKLHRR